MPFALTATVSMLIVLGVMVLVHEFGHFAVAKLCGVRVEVFSIGFGTRLFGFRRGDTDYRVSLLPLGGYVKMAGELGGDGTMPVSTAANPPGIMMRDSGDLNAHPRWQRILIGLAGPAANFVLAFVLMAGLYMMHNEVEVYLSNPAVMDFVPQDSAAAKAGLTSGDRIVRFDSDHNPTWEKVRVRAALDANTTVPVTVERTVNGQTTQFSTMLFLADPSKGQDFEIESLGLLPQEQPGPLLIHDVTPGYPAEKAGLKAGDGIVSINGQTIHSVSAVMAYLQQAGSKPVNLVIDRDGKILPVTTTPIEGDDGAGHMGYRLGFHPVAPPFRVEQLPLPEAVKQSVTYNVHYSGYIFEVLQRLLTHRSDIQQLSGPIGIARETGEAVTMKGWQPIIGLTALISLNLGIMNLLPIPILDGGMILLLLIEGTLRRDLKQEFKERVYQVAFVMLILFFAFIMFNDVSKLNLFSKLKP
ncbi:RIP metalloprotease RseP [Paracidobacterium acidisoli]|uniref:Zinc metalloprotease n=1 Tax=Paracidobacterium acidisoli TaxID=2303751 RepID=A0A372IUD0_9BACT|nr:RIP metalloprotease RseP [Paracidobacterium acidisoli]MBT9330005.1 RIP metalloprotease RseP [Paracidobacterium acidisoli]